MSTPAPTECVICVGAPAGSGLVLCPPCAGLLRWVRDYLAEVNPAGSPRIDPETLIDALFVDSLDWMFWLLAAEAAFDIAIDDFQALRIGDVGTFVRRLNEAGARWPDDRSIRLLPRRGWCSPHRWEVVIDAASHPPG